MKFLQLTTVVRDIRTTRMVAQPFFRSPATVGRRDSNALRLDAPSVSRHHGAFLFSKRGLQYVDLHSANGTFIDGRRAETEAPTDLRDSSVITIGPFQIVAHLDLVSLPTEPSDPEASTIVLADVAPHSSVRRPFREEQISAGQDAVRAMLSRHDPATILDRAVEILRATADLIVSFRGAIHNSSSPLSRSTTSDDIVAHLLDPEGGSDRVDELRTLLTDMARFPLTLLRDGPS
jgi:pSer/pThr/pTyr-binding forkhead associated (FHA) protein